MPPRRARRLVLGQAFLPKAEANCCVYRVRCEARFRVTIAFNSVVARFLTSPTAGPDVVDVSLGRLSRHTPDVQDLGCLSFVDSQDAPVTSPLALVGPIVVNEVGDLIGDLLVIPGQMGALAPGKNRRNFGYWCDGTTVFYLKMQLKHQPWVFTRVGPFRFCTNIPSRAPGILIDEHRLMMLHHVFTQNEDGLAASAAMMRGPLPELDPIPARAPLTVPAPDPPGSSRYASAAAVSPSAGTHPFDSLVHATAFLHPDYPSPGLQQQPQHQHQHQQRHYPQPQYQHQQVSPVFRSAGSYPVGVKREAGNIASSPKRQRVDHARMPSYASYAAVPPPSQQQQQQQQHVALADRGHLHPSYARAVDTESAEFARAVETARAAGNSFGYYQPPPGTAPRTSYIDVALAPQCPEPVPGAGSSASSVTSDDEDLPRMHILQPFQELGSSASAAATPATAAAATPATAAAAASASKHATATKGLAVSEVDDKDAGDSGGRERRYAAAADSHDDVLPPTSARMAAAIAASSPSLRRPAGK